MHVITGLADGGAEAVLYRLCRSDAGNQHMVVSLREDDKFGPLLRAIGVPVVCLDMPRGRVRVGGLIRLWRLLRKQCPDVVQTWMYHGDLVGGVVARLAGRRNVIWGLHHTTLEPSKSKRATILVSKICARLSQVVPRQIICCAQSTRRDHEEVGYDKEKLRVVNNGYDLAEFQPNPGWRIAVRRDLDIPLEAMLVGMVGRFDPQKDHVNLLNAVAKVRCQGDDVYCVLVGPGCDPSNEPLNAWIRGLGLTGRVVLVGQRSDIPAVMIALDVHVLSSAYGEAFPNVLAEAMACGTPCVATDVGDAAIILGETGWVVAARSDEALAEGLIKALTALRDDEGWRLRKVECRDRIERHFTVDVMALRYNEVWDSCF